MTEPAPKVEYVGFWPRVVASVIDMLLSAFDAALNTVNVRKGNFLMLFSTRQRAVTYLCSVLIGLPIWFTVGVLINQAPGSTRTPLWNAGRKFESQT